MPKRPARRPAHRPRGLASRCILIFPKPSAPGFYVHIGLDLYDRLRKPKRVVLDAREGGWQLASAKAPDGYAIQVRPGNTPRFSVGQERFESLGLREGQHPALVVERRVMF